MSQLIWKASLPTKRKIGMIGLFTGGIITAVFGFLRCIIILTTPGPAGAAAAGQWSIRESFVAIIVTNTPLIFPYFNKLWRNYNPKSSNGKSTNGGYALQDHNKISASVFSRRGGRRHPTPYSIPGDGDFQRTDSEEKIIEAKLASTRSNSDVEIGQKMSYPDQSSCWTQVRGGGWPSVSEPQNGHPHAVSRDDNIKVTTTVDIVSR